MDYILLLSSLSDNFCNARDLGIVLDAFLANQIIKPIIIKKIIIKIIGSIDTIVH